MVVSLFLIWLVLNGKITLEICATGVIITALVAIFLCRFLDFSIKKELRYLRRLPLLLRYLGVLVLEIMKANITVLKIVFNKNIKVKQTLITFDVDLKTDFCRFLLANSITLTPGTITVSTEGSRFTVHCLSREMIDGIGSFTKLLKKLEA